MIRKVILYPASVLAQSAEPVTEFGTDLEQLVQDMFETMDQYDGLGLAAPQVGVSKQVFVLNHMPKQEGSIGRLVMINPKMLAANGEVSEVKEGCLSIPGVEVPVCRPDRVVFSYMTLTHEPRQIEARGLLSRAMQHEYDHLNGRMTIDYLSSLKRKLVTDRWMKDRQKVVRQARQRMVYA